MSDKRIVIKVDECQILQTVDDMCAESLPPDLHNSWEEIKSHLIYTRKRLEPLSLTCRDIAAIIKQRETPIVQEVFTGTLDALNKLVGVIK